MRESLQDRVLSVVRFREKIGDAIQCKVFECQSMRVKQSGYRTPEMRQMRLSKKPGEVKKIRHILLCDRAFFKLNKMYLEMLTQSLQISACYCFAIVGKFSIISYNLLAKTQQPTTSSRGLRRPINNSPFPSFRNITAPTIQSSINPFQGTSLLYNNTLHFHRF